jgi:hypothetical protein
VQSAKVVLLYSVSPCIAGELEVTTPALHQPRTVLAPPSHCPHTVPTLFLTWSLHYAATHRWIQRQQHAMTAATPAPTVFCLLSNVCCVLSAVCCLLFTVCCLLSAVCRLLFAVRCLLSAVCCLLSAFCFLLSVVSALCCSHCSCA